MNRKLLILALFLLAVSAFLLHYRIHPFLITSKLDPTQKGLSPTYFIASLLPAIDAVIVTALFMSRKTAVYGYLLNGLIVIYGVTMMGHFSINNIIMANIPPSDWILKSTFKDICIAMADFFVGKVVYDSYFS